MRPAVLAGGTFPGPILREKFVVFVVNHLTDLDMLTDTTIHGIDQNASNWADKPDFITQGPVLPPVRIPLITVSRYRSRLGTFWSHSHLSTQSCDGLWRLLIVYDPYDPLSDMYDVDNDDTIITFAEWYQAGFGGGINSAILRHHGAPKDPGPREGGVDVVHRLELSIDIARGLIFVNNAYFTLHSVPYSSECSAVFSNAAVEITLPGGLASGLHPYGILING
ncbi:hypothetical protein BXZ70DRAFT_1011404 [Cristinia sonorae]|uniref:laccase n=1 Tax=Cristinia sonorae TaxID=1940300 RepID=A0A8K0UGJ2_9AGAR|nr:hypothetical protein BXZ70DRAFT_1011404 [Cristinia sonorae]